MRKTVKTKFNRFRSEKFCSCEDKNASGSSDIGNASMVCPTVYCEIDTGKQDQKFLHIMKRFWIVHGENAKNTLHISTKAMAYTALQIFLDKELLKNKSIRKNK